MRDYPDSGLIDELMAGMDRKPKEGLKGALIVWAIGLGLGILTGTLTARLLMVDRHGEAPPAGTSIRDRIFGDRS